MSAEERPSPLKRMIHASHGPIVRAWDQVGSSFEDGLHKPLRAGLEAHREMVGALGLDAECPPASDERAQSLLDYRKLVGDELLEPASRFLRSQPAGRLVDAVHRGVKEARTEVEALEASVVTPWPDDALVPRESDSWRRRSGKVIAKGFSAARKGGEDRAAPCREVALAHLSHVVVPAEDRATVEIIAAWGAWAAELERLVVAWADPVLPALVRLERFDDDESREAWELVRSGAAALDDGLRALLAKAPTASFAADAEARMAELAQPLAADFAVAGSFLWKAGREGGTPAELSRCQRVRAAFESWDAGVQARIDLYVSLLAIMAGTTAVQHRFVWRFRDQCLTSIGGLEDVALDLEAIAGQLGSDADVGRLEERVRPLLSRAAEAVPEPAVVGKAVTGGSDAMVDALLAMVRRVPTTLKLNPEQAKPPARSRVVERRPIAAQELARQAYDALRVERVRAAAAGLNGSVDAIREHVVGLPDVFDFARDAAQKEREQEGPEARSRATELLVEALRSMADSMRQEVSTIESALTDAKTRLATELGDGSLGLLDRVAAGRMQAQLLAAQSRVADFRARLNETLGPPLERRIRALRVWGLRVWRLLTRSFRKGTEMVGGSTGEQSESTRIVKTLADADALAERLPLVYQRLFTLDALSDVSLLAGREGELEAAMTRWRRWKSEDGVPIIFHGRQGVGITSFVNAFCAAMEADEGRVLRISLDDRLLSETELADVLAGALELGAAEQLADVATSVFQASADALPHAVAIDNIEHLFLRVPGGTDLIERLLTLMAETEPRIFWIGGCTTSAWQLVTAGEPTAVSQVDVIELPSLKADAIREAVKARHRRSGLPIRYEEPARGRKILRRRLRRTPRPEEVQRILEEDFFDQLERSSGGDVRLALFQWLQVADFSADGVLTVRAVDRPNFSVLASLSLTQNFTLKAFLEHRTLSLSEHDQIFRLPRQESYQIFESLGNRHLIAVVSAEGVDREARSEVQVDLRYEVQPLLAGAVITHLRGRNIVH